ncbi:MAG TPA: cytochrome oxidase subunit I, partial [Chitinophagales bacterium]|nr:cytochrome oxidase subunit I [Chitinophagales bacterium]
MESKYIYSEWGIIITIILISIPVIIASAIAIVKGYSVLNNYLKKKEVDKFNVYLKGLSSEDIEKLKHRKSELEFTLSNNELAGDIAPIDNKGLINNINEVDTLRFIEQKKKSQPRPFIEPDLTKLILWYLGCATFWLLFGT